MLCVNSISKLRFGVSDPNFASKTTQFTTMTECDDTRYNNVCNK